jgi:Arc/MetJ-type ribon-helix-helix transcriptional regulator
MTIRLNSKQEQAVRDAIESGLFRSVDEFIDSAIAGLPLASDTANREEAIRRMAEFGEQHHLRLGEPVTRKLVREGRRY